MMVSVLLLAIAFAAPNLCIALAVKRSDDFDKLFGWIPLVRDQLDPADVDFTWPTVLPSTYPPPLPSTETSPEQSSSEEQLGQLFQEMFDIILGGPDDKTTDGTELSKKGDTIEKIADSEKKAQGKDPHCDLVKSYYVLHNHHGSSDRWSVLFELKDTVFSTWDDVIGYYVVRSTRISHENSSEVEETHFSLVPWAPHRRLITLENLHEGEQVVQICSMTAAFKPSFLDNDEFSWAKDAPTYTLNLKPAWKKVDEESKKSSNDKVAHW
jgi:hypothetical protein